MIEVNNVKIPNKLIETLKYFSKSSIVDNVLGTKAKTELLNMFTTDELISICKSTFFLYGDRELFNNSIIQHIYYDELTQDTFETQALNLYQEELNVFRNLITILAKNVYEQEYTPIFNTEYTLETESKKTGTESTDGNASSTTKAKTSTTTYNSTYDLGKVESGEVVSQADPTENENSSTADSTVTYDTKDTYKEIKKGNIGVTETTAMLDHELEFRIKNNLIENIQTYFVNSLCLNVY